MGVLFNSHGITALRLSSWFICHVFMLTSFHFIVHPASHPCTHSPSRPATTSSIFSFHSVLFAVRWTTVGRVHSHQSMMSSTHRLGGCPLVLSPSTMPSITVFTSLSSSSILHLCLNNRNVLLAKMLPTELCLCILQPLPYTDVGHPVCLIFSIRRPPVFTFSFQAQNILFFQKSFPFF